MPLSEGLPLAERPHLLQPNARKEDLFGLPTVKEDAESTDIRLAHLGLSSRIDNEKDYTNFLKKSKSESNDQTRVRVSYERTRDFEEMDISEELELIRSAMASRKPPPLVKIGSSGENQGQATESSPTPTTMKWSLPQNSPQDLSINTSVKNSETGGDSGVAIKRAPIIVSPKKQLLASSSSTATPSRSAQAAAKSVIVCHRPASAVSIKCY